MAEKPTTPQNTPTRPPFAGFGMGRGPGAGGAVEKPKDFRGTMRNLIRYLRPFQVSIAIVLIFAIASTAFMIAGPKILGNVTNKVVTGFIDDGVYDQVMAHLPAGTKLPPGTTVEMILSKMPQDLVSKIPAAELVSIKNLDISRRPGIDFNGVAKLIEGLIILYLFSAAFSYLQGWIMSGLSQKVTFNLRRDISLKINKLPLGYFDRRTHGEVLSRVTNDVDTVSQTLNQSLTQIVTAVTTILGILFMMLTISWQMTLVAIIVLPISLALVALTVGRSQRYFIRQQNSLGRINGHVEEMFSGHTVMKAFNGEHRSISDFRRINGDLYDSAWKSQFLSGLLFPLMAFVGNLGYVAVAVMGGWLAINGKINIGDIQAFIQYMNQFTQPIAQTANIANVLQSTAAAAERVFEFLAGKNEVAEAKNPVSLPKVTGAVDFDNVVFSYAPETPVIRGFTAHIKPGQQVAIVGPTGAGKTTMVNLLMRFYDVNSGVIYVDGINIRDMKRADLRRLFGMVLQDTWLFNGTIEDNIAYGKADASHAQVVAAAQAAQADHFIKALPGSYNMKLNEEADNISQGEKQLLTIARAMLADAPILILDEATSSVDTRTESLVQAGMKKLMKGRTSFVIAHRLSTIKNADLILVMRDGNIVEQGTHGQLLSQSGFYAMLYNSQFTKNN
jgi:ATP-binding cassette, subfamily B, multidrug efflux pump